MLVQELTEGWLFPAGGVNAHFKALVLFSLLKGLRVTITYGYANQAQQTRTGVLTGYSIGSVLLGGQAPRDAAIYLPLMTKIQVHGADSAIVKNALEFVKMNSDEDRSFYLNYQLLRTFANILRLVLNDRRDEDAKRLIQYLESQRRAGRSK